MGHIELEQFALADGVTRDAFGVLDDAVQAWCHVHRAGLRRRTTAFGDDGSVLVVALFSGPTAPAALDAAGGGTALGEPVDAFRRAIEAGSYRRSVFEDRG